MTASIVSSAVTEKHKEDWVAMARDGQEVYDRLGNKVGKIHGAYGGAAQTSTPQPSIMAAPVAGPMATQQAAPVVETVVAPAKVPVFDDRAEYDDSMPKELRARLEHDGFIRIDAGFLKHHRYALRDQIERIDGDRVTLNVAADELIKH